VRRRREAAEAADESFWGRPRQRRLPLTGSYVVDGLVLTVGALVIATLVGLAVLWPHGRLSHAGQFGPIRTVGGIAERVETVPCKLSSSHSCRIVHVKLLEGPQKGQATLLTTVASVGSLDVAQGDRIRVYRNTVPAGTGPATHGDAYSFADFDRRNAMLWLGIGLLVLLLLTGRVLGLRALVGLLRCMVFVVE